MGENSKIEWLAGGSTWNMIRAKDHVTGRVGWHCVHKSEACRFCYAETMNRWRGTRQPYKPGLVPNPISVFLDTKTLLQPLRRRQGQRIFPCSMTDLFGEWVQDHMIDKVFAVMSQGIHHAFLPLTKRPERAVAYLTPQTPPFSRDYVYSRVLGEAAIIRAKMPKRTHHPISDPTAGAWWPQVMIGCSVGDQKDADEFRPHMAQLAAQGWRTWVSYEPALGPVNWTGWEFLRWMVSGGESGSRARPSHPDWHRATRDWCSKNGIAYHFKQWGEWAANVGAVDGWDINDDPEISHFDHREWGGDQWGDVFRPMWCDFSDGNYDQTQCVSRIGKKRAGRKLDGVEHNGFPEARR